MNELIREDPVFMNPNPQSPSQQRSIYFQLFVALSRIASEGDGWCIDTACDVFIIGHGTLLLYTERVCLAINKHIDVFVRWPNAAAHKSLSALGESKYGFPGFVASCDGTMIGLRRAPAFNMFPKLITTTDLVDMVLMFFSTTMVQLFGSPVIGLLPYPIRQFSMTLHLQKLLGKF
jgi:hypothetical protein